jgi:RNA polymerase-interacting CarD/CdnL/TRCF family regulator
MDYQIGEKVIHGTHGLGEIAFIEEKTINKHLTQCYVLRTPDLMIWIPIDGEQTSLRKPTPPEEFGKLFEVLAGPGEKLPDDRVRRKDQLTARMKDGALGSLCQVVRDLTYFQRSTKLNDQERVMLERVIKSLLTEWTYSLGVPMSQAQQSLTSLLAK